MIADSSVLIVMARAQRLDLLHRAVGVVQVTRAVRDEAIGADPLRPDAAALQRALERRRLVPISAAASAVSAVNRRYPNLGRGEASCIAAALERRQATVLMDERPARRAAALEGRTPIGSLGLLARARTKKILKTRDEVAAALRDVLGAGLWVSPEVVEAFWQGLGERR